MAIRIFVDEDTQGHELLLALRIAGYDVQTVSEAGLEGKPDPVVLRHASELGRTVLTRNGDDFRALHEADSGHAGILILHDDKYSRPVLSSVQVVRAISNIVGAGIELSGYLCGLEQWNY